MCQTLTFLSLAGNSLRDDVNNLYNFLAQPNALKTLDLSATECAIDAVSQKQNLCFLEMFCICCLCTCNFSSCVYFPLFLICFFFFLSSAVYSVSSSSFLPSLAPFLFLLPPLFLLLSSSFSVPQLPAPHFKNYIDLHLARVDQIELKNELKMILKPFFM